MSPTGQSLTNPNHKVSVHARFISLFRQFARFACRGRRQCSAQQALPYTPHSARIELLSQFKEQKEEFLKSPLSVRFPRCGPESAENERQEEWRSLVVARRVLRERARGRGVGLARGVAKRLGGARAGLHAQSVQDAVTARAHKQLRERDAREETRQHSHQLRGSEQRWETLHHLVLLNSMCVA